MPLDKCLHIFSIYLEYTFLEDIVQSNMYLGKCSPLNDHHSSRHHHRRWGGWIYVGVTTAGIRPIFGKVCLDKKKLQKKKSEI